MLIDNPRQHDHIGVYEKVMEQQTIEKPHVRRMRLDDGGRCGCKARSIQRQG